MLWQPKRIKTPPLWQLYLVFAWFLPPNTAASPLLHHLEDYTLWSSQVRSCSTRNHNELQCQGVMWRSKVLLLPANCVNVDRGAPLFVHRSVVLGDASCDYIANALNTETRRAVDIHVHPKHDEPIFDLAMVYLDEPFLNIYAAKFSEVKGFNLIEEWLQQCIAISEVTYDLPEIEAPGPEHEEVLIFPKLTTAEALKLFVTAIVFPMVVFLLVFYLIIMYPDFKSRDTVEAYENITDDVKSELDVYKTVVKM